MIRQAKIWSIQSTRMMVVMKTVKFLGKKMHPLMISRRGARRSRYCKSLAFTEIMKRKEVNYERFDSFYWPHFNAAVTRRLDSSVAFTQIMSHIKGGLEAIKSPDCKMSRNNYILMSERRDSTLSVEQSEIIYDIFMHYEKEKQSNGDFDISDVVNHLHGQLRSNGYLGQKLDFIYIDEVQDLTMAQIALLKHVCNNIHEGFVFAGDTAQTIARGIDFRFENVRSLFYTEFLAGEESDCMSPANKSETKACSQKGKSKTETSVPDLFHLSQNFRAHTGIIKLAQSVVELLYFFPFAVDKFSPETSLVYGEAPIYLEMEKDESLITTIFGHGENFGSDKYEFGAEQAILVRDELTKSQVLSQVGKQGLVLTILECKGLEFQDVLLYNFFSTSPLGRKWRVIYEFMKQKGFSDHKPHPMFDSSRHDLLCSEIKQLDVTITRAKQRLWIYDENREYSKPILDYWKQLGLIQLRRLDSSLVESMYVASSCEGWKQRGIQV
eukprot:Gb_27269 [translate_table: standard]